MCSLFPHNASGIHSFVNATCVMISHFNLSYTGPTTGSSIMRSPRFTLKFNLRRAAKARVDRMCKPHGKRTWLNVPQWLRDEWRSGNKDDIADVLRDVNFNKDRYNIWSTNKATN